MTVPKEVVCKCCKDVRTNEGSQPRILYPVFINGWKDPVLLCDHCDGDALRRAKDVEASGYGT